MCAANTGLLRLKGRNVVENRFVKMGAYHTVDLELNCKFTLTKQEWDSVAIDRIDRACNPVHVKSFPVRVFVFGQKRTSFFLFFWKFISEC